jgi:hypothetical protein
MFKFWWFFQRSCQLGKSKPQASNYMVLTSKKLVAENGILLRPSVKAGDVATFCNS